MDRLGDLALHLEAGQKRLEELAAPDTRCALADRERRRQRRHRRMRQQAEDAIGARRQLRVVPVERVAAVPLSSAADAALVRNGVRGERPSTPVARRRSAYVVAQDARPGRGRAGEHDAKTVDDAALAHRNRIRRHRSSRALSMKSTTAPVIDVWAVGVAATAAPSDIPVFTTRLPCVTLAATAPATQRGRLDDRACRQPKYGACC